MRMPNLPKKPGVRPLALLLAALFTAAAVAGCLGSDEQDEEENGDGPFAGGFEPRPTHPSLDIVLAAPDESWTGENVTFDGSGSSAMDAQIVSWTFDLGDGTVIELTGEEEPLVDHNYTVGGVYQVNLTAEARSYEGNQSEDGSDGNESVYDGSGNESVYGGSGESQKEPIVETTSLLVVVHDRFVVEETELEAGLSSGDSREHAFAANDGAMNLTVNLSVENTDFLMDAEGTLRILNPAGEAIAEETFTIEAGETGTLVINGSTNATGEHLLEVELESGAITYDGTIEVTYTSEADTGEEDATGEDEE